MRCLYLLTIRDGLVTRHIGPYTSPKQAVDDLDRLLASFGERARWQIHELEGPGSLLEKPRAPNGREPQSMMGSSASPVAA